MIYLFGSDYRQLYSSDVLNLLALPEGATVIHRYRARGGTYQHVHPDVLRGLSRRKQRGKARQIRRGVDRLTRCGGRVGLVKAEDVVLSFVDRNDDYKYYPLRRGTLYDTWERDGRLYFRVQLGEFVAAKAGAIDDVSERMKGAVNHEGPSKSTNPESETDDGKYAIAGQDVLGYGDMLEGEDAWNASVDALGKTRTFRASGEQATVFVRASIEGQKGRRRALPSLAGHFERIVIPKDTAYELRVSYRCASAGQLTGVATIGLETGDGLQVLHASPLVVQASADDVVVPLVSKRYAEERYSQLNLSVHRMAENAPARVLGPSVKMLIAFRERRTFWAKVVFLLGLFTLSTLVVGLKSSDVQVSASPTEFARSLWAQVAGWRLAAAVLQTAAIFGLFRLIGKKPV